jgi:tetratricopeptide (TPR) repeat protein
MLQISAEFKLNDPKLQALSEAVSTPEAALPKPADLRALTRRGILRAKSGDLTGAIDDYTTALELEPGHLPALANRGVARFHSSDLLGAINDCTRAIDLDPTLSKAWLVRGLAHAELGKWEAEDDLSEFCQLDPNSKYLPLARRALVKLERAG